MKCDFFFFLVYLQGSLLKKLKINIPLKYIGFCKSRQLNASYRCLNCGGNRAELGHGERKLKKNLGMGWGGWGWGRTLALVGNLGIGEV